MYKKILFIVMLFSNCYLIKTEDHVKSNFFTQFEPQAFKRSYTSITNQMAAFQKNSGFDAKIFNLFALSAAAGMKCEYCVMAHTYEAKKAGATDDEIKAASPTTNSNGT